MITIEKKEIIKPVIVNAKYRTMEGSVVIKTNAIKVPATLKSKEYYVHSVETFIGDTIYGKSLKVKSEANLLIEVQMLRNSLIIELTRLGNVEHIESFEDKLNQLFE